MSGREGNRNLLHRFQTGLLRSSSDVAFFIGGKKKPLKQPKKDKKDMDEVSICENIFNFPLF